MNEEPLHNQGLTVLRKPLNGALYSMKKMTLIKNLNESFRANDRTKDGH